MCSRINTEVTHELHSCLDDICHVAIGFCIAGSMVGFIRFYKLWEFAVIPVKLTAVYDDTADLNGMTIHIFTCGMYNDIGTKVKRLTKDRGCKCIVHDQWNTHSMSDICKTFNIKYR